MAEATEYPPHKKPKYEQRSKIHYFCDTIATAASVDYTNNELNDIQVAVDTMLQTIVTRVNKRGVFNVAGIQAGGSMAEKTSIWKYHWDKDEDGGETAECNYNRPFIEFDYLAVLEGSSQDDQACPGCTKLTRTPVNLEQLNRFYSREDEYTTETLKNKSELNELFWHEINGCLTSSCDCLTFNNDRVKWKFNRQLAFQRTSANQTPFCDKCCVSTPTGTLGAAILPSNQAFPDRYDCSLIFMWTSKAKSLFAPDKLLLHTPRQMSSLFIYVDFLPSLKSREETSTDEETSDDKETSTQKGQEHDHFVVPKRCNVCVFANRAQIKNYESPGMGWRKSWCKTELNEIVNEMSDKHKKCYQILKYLRDLAPDEYINNYHMKIAILRHNRNCSETTNECAECVVKLLEQLRKSYESKKLISPYSNRNLLRQDGYYDAQKRFCEMRLDDLCSLSDSESWKTFINKCCLGVSSLSS